MHQHAHAMPCLLHTWLLLHSKTCCADLCLSDQCYICSQLVAGVAIAAFMVPLSQIQTLEEITWLAYAGAQLIQWDDRCSSQSICAHLPTMHVSST